MEVKREQEALKMKLLAEETRRQKAADAAQRAKVKALIEEDRRRRAGLPAVGSSPAPVPAAAPAATPTPAAPAPAAQPAAPGPATAGSAVRAPPTQCRLQVGAVFSCWHSLSAA